MSRPKGLGGTDAASIVGFNQYVSPYRCYLQKLGLIEKEPVGPAAAIGNWLEPRILQRHAIEQGVAVVTIDRSGGLPPWEAGRIVFLPDGTVLPLGESWIGQDPDPSEFYEAARLLDLHHAEHGYLLTFLDGVACDPDDGTPLYLIDVKTVGPNKAHEWGAPYTDQLPKIVTVQFQHYDTNLRSHGVALPWKVLTLFRGPATEATYVFEPSEALADRLLRAELAFWRRLQRRDPPELDESETTFKALNQIWREDRGKMLISEPGDRLEELARIYRGGQLMEKEGARTKRLAGGGLKLVMREAAKIQGAGWSFSWTTPVKKTKVDHEAALIEFRNLIATRPAYTEDIWRESVLRLLEEALAAHTTTKTQARSLHPSVGKLDALPPPKEEHDDQQLEPARPAGPALRAGAGGDPVLNGRMDGRPTEVPDA